MQNINMSTTGYVSMNHSYNNIVFTATIPGKINSNVLDAWLSDCLSGTQSVFGSCDVCLPKNYENLL